MAVLAMVRVFILSAACAMVSADMKPTPEPKFNFRGSGQFKKEEVAEILAMEEKGSEMQAHFEKELEPLYLSLPKNEHGNIEHMAARYALHRLFVRRHGWYIRGLEPGNSTWMRQRADGSMPPAWVAEWMPAFLEQELSKKAQHGTSLRDVAALGATIEDLVHREVNLRLRKVYEVHSDSPTVSLPRTEAEAILDTYYITFLLANNFTAQSKAHLEKKKAAFHKRYKGYDVARKWLETEIMPPMEGKSYIDFDTISSAVHNIGLKYHTLNQVECSDLRTTLQKMESKKAGRVRLSVFYNLSRFTHWKFVEKPEYLKKLGALDDTDPQQPSLITANYITARPNCLDSSNVYTLCCSNPCEDLMVHLEGNIGQATASPEKLVALVSEMPSDTVQAPRVLSPALLNRLSEVAGMHDGQVPLHGRLFAQWMHHAYPRECPFPHESGSISPQTADEWTREMGSSSQTSEEERQKLVENDVCAVGADGHVDCGEESAELPWSTGEELLTMSAAHRDDAVDAQTGQERRCGFVTFCLFACSAMLFGISMVQRKGGGMLVTRAAAKRSLSTVAAAVLAFLLLTGLDLVDEGVFFFALSLTSVVYTAGLVATRGKDKLKMKEEML